MNKRPKTKPQFAKGELRRLRSALDLTQVQLAHEMGITGNSWARWERGATVRHPTLVRAMIELLSLRRLSTLAYGRTDTSTGTK
jgi:transcriptional regulator with XRE-family HTH domain